MSENTRTSYKAYSAWNYQQEIKDLNAASEQGWQLVKGGCFHSKFRKDPTVRYIYQMDYQRIDDMPRYIETFREQGWEYINSTFNNWHYLRKLYDPSLQEEEYEIFTDKESLHEMNDRWAKGALAIGIILGLFALLWIVRLIRQPCLPALIQVLLFAVESAVLIRGFFIMHNPESKRIRRGDSAFLNSFFIVLILGLATFLILTNHRPNLKTSQRASSEDRPVVDERWLDFEIDYTDNYFLDLELKGEEPLTFRIKDEEDKTVYEQTSKDFKEDGIRLRLSRGKYWLTLSRSSGFEAKCELE